MKTLYAILLFFFCFTLLSSSCKKHVIQPVTQLSLLPPATQTGANTFGCLINGQAFVPKNRSILQGPVMQCNYIYLHGGYYFNVSGGNNNSAGYPVAVLIQTDSLSISEGKTLTLTNYNTSGSASGSYDFSSSTNDYYLNTNQNLIGQLHITHFDPVKQIVSGTFYFNVLENAGDTVKITDGRFDMPYTR